MAKRLRHYFARVPLVAPVYRWLKQKVHGRYLYLDARDVAGVSGRVHRYDFMLADDTEESVRVYNQIGLDAVKLIEEAARSAGGDVGLLNEVLDFGCGYGRVTRVLIQHIDPKRITVFDVDPGATAFCAHEFKVKPLTFRKKWDFQTVPFGLYDLIWVGSVFTHLSESYAVETLATLCRILALGGLLIFTTHDRNSLLNIRAGHFGDRVQQIVDEIEDQFTRNGVCFIPFQHAELDILPFVFQRREDFGMTWMSQDYVEDLVGRISAGRLVLLRHIAKGWGGHQAVFMYRKQGDETM